MKSTILTAILLLAVITSFSQNKETMLLKAKWQKGEAKELMLIKSGSATIYGDERISPPDTSRYSIFIADKTEEGYIVVWKALYELPVPVDEGYEFVMEYASQYKFIILTDTNGSFRELVNWEELLKLNKKFKSEIYSTARKEGLGKEIVDEMLVQRNLPETKEALLNECNFLAGVFLGVYGNQVRLNDSITEPTTITNPNFKEGIPVTQQTVTRETDNERIGISYKYLYDYEKLKEIVKKEYPGIEYSEDKSDSSSEYIYNHQTGWVERVETIMKFESSSSKSNTKLEYLIK